MVETENDRLMRYRREHALWALEGMMTWCLEHGDEQQLQALTNLEVVLNGLMVETAMLRAALVEVAGYENEADPEIRDVAGIASAALQGTPSK